MVRLIQQPTGGIDLLEQYRQSGSPDLFAQIMRAYGGMVLSVCYKVTKDSADAEDASQAVFLTLAIQCKTGTPIQYLGPWLKKVAKRTALDLVRSRKRRTRRETVTAENRPEHYNVRPGAAPEADELNAILRAELDELPAKYRMPLVLHYFGGMSHDQIAKEMGCTTAALGVRLHRARKMLGKRLSGRGISLEGAALGAALAVAIPAVFTDRFIHSTNAAVMGLSYAQPVAGFGAMALPDNFASVVSMVSQVSQTMAKQRLKMATAVLAASISLLGGAAEAIRLLPENIRPSLEFLAPSQLLKNLLTPNVGVPRVQAPAVANPSLATVDLPHTESAFVVPVPTPLPLSASTNQPILAFQWTPPVPQPTANTGPVSSLPKLSLGIAPAPRAAIAPTTLARTATAVVQQTTPGIDSAFRGASGGGSAPAPAAETPSSPTPDRPQHTIGHRDGPAVPDEAPDVLARPISSNVPRRHDIGGFTASAVGGATYNHVPALPALPGATPGPAQVPIDKPFVPDSVVLRHGDVFVPGDGKYAWSDRLVSIEPHGTNAAELKFTGVTPGGGVFSIERIPVTTTLAPVRPTGHHFVGIWAMGSTFGYDTVSITAHYDLAFAESLGLPENVLKLWVFDPARTDWFRIQDASFARDMAAHTLTGTYAGTATFFAVSAPEPAVLGVLTVAGGLLLRRRRA